MQVSLCKLRKVRNGSFIINVQKTNGFIYLVEHPYSFLEMALSCYVSVVQL